MSNRAMDTHHRTVDWDAYLHEVNSSSYTDTELVRPYLSGMILDVGCSFGNFLGWVKKTVPLVGLYGVDPSAYAIKTAKDGHPDIEFNVGVAEHLDFPSDYFDVITAFEVVEHLIRPELFIQEARRVLRKNGMFILQTPNYPIKRIYDCLYWLFGKNKTYKDDATHCSPFSFGKLERLLKTNDFCIMRSVGRNMMFEQKIPLLKRCKRMPFFKHFSQKMIIISTKKA